MANRSVKIIGFAHAGRIIRIEKDRQLAETWNRFTEKFKPLACNVGLLNGHSSHVATWMREVSDQPSRYWVDPWYKR